MTHSPIISDVLIIGAGPAGATASALLAERGVRVVVLEKEVFPRFHIGESLLPRVVPIMERLGVSADEFLVKEGAEFLDEDAGLHNVYPFRHAMPGGPPTAFQVDRATFDKALADAATRMGAQIEYGAKATKVDVGADSATVEAEIDGEKRVYQARYLIDATGQDAFLGRRDRTITPIGEFGKAAVFTHFHDIQDRLDREFGSTGNIKVLILDDGWSWVIPLKGGKVSVGIVSRKQGIQESWLDELIASSPLLSRLTSGARRGPTRIIRNFSYKNRQVSGPRYACIGDAAAFLDPVFSSGVTLAMESGEQIAELLANALKDGREAEPELAAPLGKYMQEGYVAMGSLVHAFYSRNLIKNVLFAETQEEGYREGLVTLLAGDLWRDDNRFRNMLFSSARRARAIKDLLGEPVEEGAAAAPAE